MVVVKIESENVVDPFPDQTADAFFFLCSMLPVSHVDFTVRLKIPQCVNATGTPSVPGPGSSLFSTI